MLLTQDTIDCAILVYNRVCRLELIPGRHCVSPDRMALDPCRTVTEFAARATQLKSTLFWYLKNSILNISIFCQILVIPMLELLTKILV